MGKRLWSGTLLRTAGRISEFAASDPVRFGVRLINSRDAWNPDPVEWLFPSTLLRQKSGVLARTGGIQTLGWREERTAHPAWRGHFSVELAAGDAMVSPPTETTMDTILESRELQVERKHFFIEYRENERGRFLRITEEAHGRRNTVIIPSTGLEEFERALDEVLSAAPQEE